MSQICENLAINKAAYFSFRFNVLVLTIVNCQKNLHNRLRAIIWSDWVY